MTSNRAGRADGPSGSTFGRGPRQDQPAEAPFSAAGGASAAVGSGGVTDSSGPGSSVDPELIDDLGAEFELRGDVVEDALETAVAEAAAMRDQVLRTQAEFDNFRKRITREREDERKRATERLVEELLPAIDNLERAIEHTSADHEIEHLITGVTSVHAQIVGVLSKAGVSVIDPTGQAFDPASHQAVSQQEDLAVPDGTVIAAFQKGYEMGGRVVRPAMVVVSTGGPRREE